jgi:hypothetical protein
MTRRRRLLLWALIVLLCLPLLALAAGEWYLHSGRLERNVEAVLSKRWPVTAKIGRIELKGSHHAVVRDFALGEAGQPPFVTAPELRVSFTFSLPDHVQLDTLEVTGAKAKLDARAWDLIQRITDIEKARPPQGPPHHLHFVVDGELDGPGGWHVGAAHVEGDDEGKVTTVKVDADYDGSPLALLVDSRPERGAQTVKIDIVQEKGRLLPVLDAASGIGLMASVPPLVRPLLPPVVDGSGTELIEDLDASSWTGQVQARWDEGDGSAEIALDPHTLKIGKLRVKDPTRLSAEGRVAVDLDNQSLVLELARWQPGPRLPIPERVPMAALLQIVPALRIEARLRDHEEQVKARLSAQGAANSWVTAEWAPSGPLRVKGESLPLTLAQDFTPPQLTINGGQATRIDLRIGADGLDDYYIEAQQARCSARGWSIGPIDGSCDIRPAPGGGIGVGVRVPPLPAAALAEVGYSGGHAGGEVTVKVARVEGLLACVHGPSDLPDLRGAIDLDLKLELEDQAFRGRLVKLALDGVTMPDLLQDLDSTIRGSFAWRDDHLQARLGGQLHRGSVRLPGALLDVAARTPIFTADFIFTPAVGYAPSALDVNEILVRAADDRGQPVAAGYSAQLGGNLTATGTGQISGVVDHADLAWINSLLSLGALSMAGEGAIAITADLMNAQMTRLEGAFLPLNADLRIGRNFQATGITGAVEFTMAKEQ